MAEHQASCIHPVSLPSIHEMFPAHLLRPEDQYNGRPKYPEPADCQHPRSRCTHSPVTHSRVLPQNHPYHHVETAAHCQSRDSRQFDVLHESDARVHTDRRKRSASHVYSFDVLRSDPMNSSLQHLASSGSLLNHSTHPPQHHGSSAVTSGSPAFRVSVPPTTAGNGTHIHNPVSIEGRPRVPQRTASDPVIPAMISFPVSAKSSKPNQSPSEDPSDEDNPGESAGKKHICPTCFKRFNRPSSLRIHVNTHTGATPFRCPFPNCGREFNVNSNMRRHYRNHTAPGLSRAQPNDNRRKRRRVDPANAPSHPMPEADQAYRRPHSTNLMPSPPISHFSASDDSEYDSDMEVDTYSIQERDELVDYHTKRSANSSTPNLSHSMARVTVTQHEPSPYSASSRYPQRQNVYGNGPHARPLTPVSNSGFHSSSPSNSPSPHLQPASIQPAARGLHSYPHGHTTKREHKYNPSAPYVHSLADTRVSTALRPAFHS